MIYKHFRLQVVLRLVIILLLGYTTIYIISETHFWLLALWTILISIVLVVNLIRFVEKSYRELQYFLLAIEQNDYSTTYSEVRETDDFKSIYQKIMGTFHHLRNEREFNHFYLKEVVDHIGTSLVGFEENGEVELLNKTARKLLQKPYLRTIDSLEKVNKELMSEINNLEPGKQKVVKISSQGKIQSLLARTTEFKLMDKSHKIVSFQDISRELEFQETESWQKLIRVLTHEITNSVIPIATLSSVTDQMITNEDGTARDLKSLDEEEADDLRGSIRTIEKRSRGLAGFVEDYKSLTQIPQLTISNFKINELIEEIKHLLKPRFKEANVRWTEKFLENDLILNADRERIEQVLINLILNALEAVEESEKGIVEIVVGIDPESRTFIKVKDNGPGISEEIIDQIFIPFFSTKDRGSGTGLSYSRQIMGMHQGTLTGQSNLGAGAQFTLIF